MLNRDSQSRRFLLWRLVEVPNCQRCVFSHNRAFRNQPHTRQNHEFVLILTGVRDEVDLAQWDFHDLSLEQHFAQTKPRFLKKLEGLVRSLDSHLHKKLGLHWSPCLNQAFKNASFSVESPRLRYFSNASSSLVRIDTCLIPILVEYAPSAK